MAHRVTLLSLFSSRQKPAADGDTSTSSSAIQAAPATPLRLNGAKVKQIIATAESIVSKWDPEASAYAKITSLWYENRQEAAEYLRAVENLQSAMHFLAAGEPFSPVLIQAQRLMQSAMKRLEKEFFQILAANRDHLDPESVSARSSTSTVDYDGDVDSDEEIREVGKSIGDVEKASSIAMADLRSIAECMIGAGYGKECLNIYKVVRKSIVDEGLYRLGIEPLSSSKIQKMDWDLLEMKIKGWTHAVKIAMRTLFFGERILCDHVFASSPSVRESCFAAITGDGARLLFGFPEAVSKGKKSPEKMFRMLDLYDAIAELWPDIESIFSYESFAFVRAQAVNSLIKLGDAVRTMLADFETAIQKDWTKMSIHGGGIHPLTRYVMNFLSLLADYRHILADITADFPLKLHLPSEIAECVDDDTLSQRFAWLILLLLCKIDGKANLYQDISLSYLFLTNNLQYVVAKVQNSDLQLILGSSWILLHVEKLRRYATSFERMAWSKVTAALAEISAFTVEDDRLNQAFRQFNSAFDDAYRLQMEAVVTDNRLREELKVSIAQKIVPTYRSLYRLWRPVLDSANGGGDGAIRFSPEDLENYISDIFHGNVSGSATSSVHSLASVRSR